MRKRFSYNNEYIVSIYSKMIIVILSLFISIFLNRFLGVELRGEYAIITNYVSISTIIFGLGLYQVFAFKKNKSDFCFDNYFNNLLGLNLIYFLISIGLYLFLDIPISIKMAILLTPIAISIKQLNYIIMIEFPNIRNTLAIFLKIIEFVLVIIFYFFISKSYFAMLFILFFVELSQFIIFMPKILKMVDNFKPTVSMLLPLIKIGILPMFTVLMMSINYRIDILMLERLEDLHQIGLYSVGVSLAERIWIVPDALKDVLLSKLVKGKGAREVIKVTIVSLLCSAVLIIPILIFGKYLIIILYGEGFADAFKTTSIIIFGTIGMIFYKMIYTFNVVRGKIGLNFSFLCISALANVILNLKLIPLYGIEGAAISSVGSYSICGIFFVIAFLKNIKRP